MQGPDILLHVLENQILRLKFRVLPFLHSYLLCLEYTLWSLTSDMRLVGHANSETFYSPPSLVRVQLVPYDAVRGHSGSEVTAAGV